MTATAAADKCKCVPLVGFVKQASRPSGQVDTSPARRPVEARRSRHRRMPDVSQVMYQLDPMVC